MRLAVSLVALAALGGCAQVDSPNAQVVLPATYRMDFAQVRSCRSSIDHDLANVVVRVRPDLIGTYNDGPYPFPQGALVVKEQYSDMACQSLSGYTVMRKEASGYFPAGGDWQYFKLDAYGTVVSSGKDARCAACHAMCGPTRDRTCTEQ
jgi:hypothetical protein